MGVKKSVTKKQKTKNRQQNKNEPSLFFLTWEMLTLYFLVLPDDKEIINRLVSANVLTESLQ